MSWQKEQLSTDEMAYREQFELIQRCINRGLDLEEELHARGLTYDWLVYSDEASPERYPCPPFIPLTERPALAEGIPCVSFFSGAGGLDLGFGQAGFENLADVEINPIFCETLRENGAHLVIGPPADHGDMNHPEEIIARLEAEGIPRNFPGVFHGGPPCQSFSIAANQRFSKNGENFKRTGFDHEQYGNLLFCYIAAITHFMPEAFLIENVDGLLNIDGGIQARRACQILEHAGYDVTPPHIVDAADFGVPQKRMRTIIMGSRIGHIDFPAPVEHHISMGSALVAPILDGDSHSPRNHKAASIDRYMKLNFGQRDKLGRVDRLDPLLPSKTVIAGGTGGGGRSHLHPFIPRTLTVRECARIQTFPDTYRFTGPMSRRFTQVGNAVPPVMAYEMACAIIRSVYQ